MPNSNYELLCSSEGSLYLFLIAEKAFSKYSLASQVHPAHYMQPVHHTQPVHLTPQASKNKNRWIELDNY